MASTRRKIFYVPGFISLMLLPAIFVVYSENYSEKVRQETAVEISNNGLEWTRGVAMHRAKIEKFDNKSLNELQALCGYLDRTYDTTYALIVEFPTGSRYQDFVRATDILGMNNILYTIDDGKLLGIHLGHSWCRVITTPWVNKTTTAIFQEWYQIPLNNSQIRLEALLISIGWLGLLITSLIKIFRLKAG